MIAIKRYLLPIVFLAMALALPPAILYIYIAFMPRMSERVDIAVLAAAVFAGATGLWLLLGKMLAWQKWIFEVFYLPAMGFAMVAWSFGLACGFGRGCL